MGAAAAFALHHMDSLPMLLLIAPGYLVQAWLFEAHRALGGFGYQATMVGVSALAWTLVILAITVPARYLWRRVRPGQTAHAAPGAAERRP
jgi:uncharacterized iron-regulated membrane protein